jgi:hypothetical protein
LHLVGPRQANHSRVAAKRARANCRNVAAVANRILNRVTEM